MQVHNLHKITYFKHSFPGKQTVYFYGNKYRLPHVSHNTTLLLAPNILYMYKQQLNSICLLLFTYNFNTLHFIRSKLKEGKDQKKDYTDISQEK